MTNEEKLKHFEDKCRHSAYSMYAHQSSIDLYEALDRLGMFLFRSEYREILKDEGLTDLSESDTPEISELVAKKILQRVPEFQRDNDKWTSDMQECFVHNLLKGIKSPDIVLYSLDGSNSNCFILDGLQRLTAVIRFLTQNDMTFPLGNDEYIESKLIADAGFNFYGMRSAAFNVKIYHFENELAAVNHYIEINEHVTHSKEDIAKAKAYRARLIQSGMTVS